MKSCRVVEAGRHTFLSSALDGDEPSASGSGHFPDGPETTVNGWASEP
jgi:hypothetical protein